MSMSTTSASVWIEFYVAGIAATSGSKRAIMPRGARFPVVVDDNKRNKPWQAQVSLAAQAAVVGGAPWSGPVRLVCDFTFVRPKTHHLRGDTSRGLTKSAPAAHTKKPDLLKLARAVEDAMSGIIYQDDSQIVAHSLTKSYGSQNGVLICVHRVLLIPSN